MPRFISACLIAGLHGYEVNGARDTGTAPVFYVKNVSVSGNGANGTGHGVHLLADNDDVTARVESVSIVGHMNGASLLSLSGIPNLYLSILLGMT